MRFSVFMFALVSVSAMPPTLKDKMGSVMRALCCHSPAPCPTTAQQCQEPPRQSVTPPKVADKPIVIYFKCIFGQMRCNSDKLPHLKTKLSEAFWIDADNLPTAKALTKYGTDLFPVLQLRRQALADKLATQTTVLTSSGMHPEYVQATAEMYQNTLKEHRLLTQRLRFINKPALIPLPKSKKALLLPETPLSMCWKYQRHELSEGANHATIGQADAQFKEYIKLLVDYGSEVDNHRRSNAQAEERFCHLKEFLQGVYVDAEGIPIYNNILNLLHHTKSLMTKYMEAMEKREQNVPKHIAFLAPDFEAHMKSLRAFVSEYNKNHPTYFKEDSPAYKPAPLVKIQTTRDRTFCPEKPHCTSQCIPSV